MSGWRFHKRIAAWPGVWLNVSRRGLSASAGIRGWLSVSSRGRRSVGIPGTGLSYVDSRAPGLGVQLEPRRPVARSAYLVALLVVILACLVVAILTR